MGLGGQRFCLILISQNGIWMCLVLQGLNQKPKSKVPVIGTALVNVAEYASLIDQKDFDLNIPLTPPGGSSESSPTLCVCPSLFSPDYHAT